MTKATGRVSNVSGRSIKPSVKFAENQEHESSKDATNAEEGHNSVETGRKVKSAWKWKKTYSLNDRKQKSSASKDGKITKEHSKVKKPKKKGPSKLAASQTPQASSSSFPSNHGQAEAEITHSQPPEPHITPSTIKPPGIVAALGKSARVCAICNTKQAPGMFVTVYETTGKAENEPSDVCFGCRRKISLHAFQSAYTDPKRIGKVDKRKHLQGQAAAIEEYVEVLSQLKIQHNVDDIDNTREPIYENELFNDLDPEADFPLFLCDMKAHQLAAGEAEKESTLRACRANEPQLPLLDYPPEPSTPVPEAFAQSPFGKSSFLLPIANQGNMELHSIALTMRNVADAIDAAAAHPMSNEERDWAVKHIYRQPFDVVSGPVYEIQCWNMAEQLKKKQEQGNV